MKATTKKVVNFLKKKCTQTKSRLRLCWQRSVHFGWSANQHTSWRSLIRWCWTSRMDLSYAVGK